MDSEVQPYDDDAGSGSRPGTGPGTRESGWPGDDPEPGPARRRFLAMAGVAAGAVPLAGILSSHHTPSG